MLVDELHHPVHPRLIAKAQLRGKARGTEKRHPRGMGQVIENAQQLSETTERPELHHVGHSLRHPVPHLPCNVKAPSCLVHELAQRLKVRARRELPPQKV